MLNSNQRPFKKVQFIGEGIRVPEGVQGRNVRIERKSSKSASKKVHDVKRNLN